MNIPKLDDLKNNRCGQSYIKSKYFEFYQLLIELYPDQPFSEKLYLYFHPEHTVHKCPVCGKDTKFDGISKGYRKYCSQKCANSDPTKKQKSKESCLKKYGCENPMQNKDCVNKLKQTYIDKYGVDNPSKSESIKEKKRQTSLSHYGVDNPLRSAEVREKIKQTNLERYGEEHPMSNIQIKSKAIQTQTELYGGVGYQSAEVHKKIKQSCLDKYGDENYSNRQQAEQTCLELYGDRYYKNHKKAKQTCLERYGVENPGQSEEIKEKIKQTCLERYGVERPSQSKSIREKSKQTCLERYGVEYGVLMHNSGNNDSKINRKFAELLSDNNIQFEREFPIKNRVYDFKIGNVLIELDPFPTHNSTWGAFNDGPKSKTYHLDKSTLAKSEGYKCIHIWDWDDSHKIIDMFKQKINIGARKCVIKTVNKLDCKSFLNTYHLQGSCNNQTIRLGLYYNEELVEIMTFGKPRYNKNYEWELLRLCVHPNYNIIGGSKRLFKFFIDSYQPNSIISYCDNSKFDGSVYERLGFKHKSKSQPSKHWFDGKTHITDNLLRQRGFDQLFKTNYGKGTSNEELMLQYKFVEIYDCGQSAWIYFK